MKRILVVTVLALGVVTLPRVDAQRPLFTTGTPAELAQARALGLDHLRVTAMQKRIDGATDIRVTRADVDRQFMAHTRAQQYFRGVPVLGGEAIAHLNADGAVFAETDALVPDISVDTTPRLTQEAAVAIATKDYGCSDCLTAAPKTDLWILRHEGTDHLVYRVEMRRIDGSNQMAKPVRFVDAHSGYVVTGYNNLQTGTGSSLYSGTVSIGTYHNMTFGDYAMQNIPLRVGTFDMRNTPGNYWVFDDPDDVWNGTTQRAGVDAHYGMEKFFAVMQNVFGRNGIDGSGGPFLPWLVGDDGVTTLVGSFVHGGMNYNNAFWDGYMLYGDGDGVTFSPLVTVDIAGHEMTHGVTEHSANLIYQNESGALNESFSDVFGSMFERNLKGESANTWLIGEQAFTPGIAGDALRYMDNPHLASDSGYTANDDPDHYTERYTGPEDNGGVHINSGIANKAFYLLAKGGSHHLGGTMTGIGPDDAWRIWYAALTSYMTSTTNFAGARTATLQAASALFGSTGAQYAGVENAWCLVGVGACHVNVLAISITPNSGTGVAQPFTLLYSDDAGVTADLTAAQVRFLPSDGAPGACVVQYKGTTNQVRIQDDAGVWGAFSPLGAGTLSNSYCLLNLATASAAPSGNNLTLTLPLTFTPLFGGPKVVAMRANSATGATTGWVDRGTWTVGATVQAISATPNAGSGATQTFALAFSDSLGATDLKQAMVRFGAANVAGGVCTVAYNAMTNTVRVQDDAGVNGPWTALGSGTLSNSQCSVDLAQTSATPSGNNLSVSTRITFTPAFAGLKNIYMRGVSNYLSNSGWQTRGTFNVGGATVTASSVTPSSGSGITRNFVLAYSDSLGAQADLKQAQVRFGTTADVAAGVCTVMYNAMTNQVRIQDDAGVNGAWNNMGSATILQNSQCSVDLAASSAVRAGNDLTLQLMTTFKSPFAGLKNIYMRANSNYGATTGWLTRGTFNAGPVLSATSITPNGMSGPSQTFTAAFSNSEGVATDLKVARVRFMGATGPACIVDYNAITNLIRLQNNDGTWTLPQFPGTGGPLTNSQCTLNVATSSAVRSGNDLTLVVDLGFKPAFAGLKNMDLRANSNFGPTTNFVNRGTFTVTP